MRSKLSLKKYVLLIVFIISVVTYLTTFFYPFNKTNLLILINKGSGLVTFIGLILFYVLDSKFQRFNFFTRIVITVSAVLVIAFTYDLIRLVLNSV